MPRAANPRMAALIRVGTRRDRPIIVARVTDGPERELGRTVHIPITPGDIPALRAALDRLEAYERGRAG